MGEYDDYQHLENRTMIDLLRDIKDVLKEIKDFLENRAKSQ